MKLRNNYNVGDRILILHANTKNQLRKNDIGKIGTILDKRCSFCIVRLDGDDRDKNYNYGTFAKITKLSFHPFGSEDKLLNFERDKFMFEYIKQSYNITPILRDVEYLKNLKSWHGIITNERAELVGDVFIEVNNKLNEKFPDETNNIQKEEKSDKHEFDTLKMPQDEQENVF